MTETPMPPPQQVVYVQAAPEPRNGFGIAALILGGGAIVFGLVPILGFIAFFAAFAGLVLALVGLGRCRQGKATNRKTTWAGLIASALGVVLSIVGIVIFFTAINDLSNDVDCFDKNTPHAIEQCQDSN